MNLDPAEKRSVWWKGALKGALKSVPTAMAVGLVAAAVMAFIAMPVIAALGGTGITALMGSFLTLSNIAGTTVGAMLPTIPGVGAPFFPIGLVVFNTAIGAVSSFFASGNQAVTTYHQQKHNAQYDAKIHELDGRTRTIEQAIARPSHATQSILAQGPRHKTSFAEAETARSAVPSGHTIH
jgi:hypothetical protein